MKKTLILISMVSLFSATSLLAQVKEDPRPNAALESPRNVYVLPQAIHWEYETITTYGIPFEKRELNDLGAKGWELVGFTTSDSNGNIRFDYVFKRPAKQAPAKPFPQ